MLGGDAIGNGRSGILLNEGDSSSAATSRIVINGGGAAGNNNNGVNAVLVGGFQISAMDIHGNLEDGILSDASRNGVITLNQVYGDVYDEFSYAEIEVSGWTGNPVTTATYVVLRAAQALM